MPDFLSNLNQDALVLWGGGLRWVYHDDAQAVADYSRQVGGWYWAVGETMPIDPMQRQIMAQLASAFDPNGVFACPLDLNRIQLWAVPNANQSACQFYHDGSGAAR